MNPPTSIRSGVSAARRSAPAPMHFEAGGRAGVEGVEDASIAGIAEVVVGQAHRGEPTRPERLSGAAVRAQGWAGLGVTGARRGDGGLEIDHADVMVVHK